MSLSSLLTKLINARGAIVDAISSKGVSISSSATLLSCASAVLNIPQGSGGIDVSDTTAEAENVQSGYYFYNSAGVKTEGTLTVSAGIDVSDTTAEAADVLSGKVFYDSAGVKTEGTLTVSAGIDVSDTTATPAMVLSGAVFHDSQGAVTTGTIPTVSAAITSGAVVVPSGYIAEPQSFPVSAGSGADVTLGYVSGGVFYELAFSGTSSIEVASSSGLSAYGWLLPVSAGDSGVVIYQPQSNYIYSSAQYMNNKSIYTPFEMHVYSGGTANSTTIETGGSMFVYSGGTANSTWVKNEYLTVYHGGVIKSTSLSGGKSIVLSGGTANYTSIYADFTVLSGGTANYTKIYGTRGSGHLTVGSGGTANYTSVGGDSGHLTVLSGGYAYSVTLVSVISAEMTISYGGSASEILIGSNTTLNISAGGTASFVTVSSGGSLMVYGSALAVNRLGPADIYSAPGAYIEYVSSGTDDTIYSDPALISSGNSN